MPTKEELVAELNQALQQTEDLKAEIDQLTASNVELSGNLDRAHQRIEEVAGENHRLVGELEAAHAGGADPELQSKFDALLKDNDRLADALGERSDAQIAASADAIEDVEKAAERVLDLKRNLNKARAALTEYDQEASVDTGSVPTSGMMSQARQELVKRVASLKAEHAHAAADLSAAKDKVNPDLVGV